MKVLLLLSLLFSLPVYSSEMDCKKVREITDVVLDSPSLTKRDKKKILRNLVGKHGMSCIHNWDAND